MARFIVRRLLMIIPILLLVTFLVYIAIRVGWSPEQDFLRANPRATAAQKEKFIQANGLYPGFSGWLRGYGEWLRDFVRGPSHWPRSIKGGSDVWEQLKYSLANTLRLYGFAAVIGTTLGVGLGIFASRNPGGFFDTLVNGVTYFLSAVPPFISAIFLQIVFAVQLGWLPQSGVYPPGHEGFDLKQMLLHLVLPVTVVAIQGMAEYSRYTRASVLETTSADYLRTARAKGLSERTVLWKHSVRNALIPVVTLIAVNAGALLGGLIITENIFNYPGMGMYFIKAINEGDTPKLLPFMVIVTISVLLFNLLADVLYKFLDPRISLD